MGVTRWRVASSLYLSPSQAVEKIDTRIERIELIFTDKSIQSVFIRLIRIIRVSIPTSPTRHLHNIQFAQGSQNGIAANGFGVEAGRAEGIGQFGIVENGADDNGDGGGGGMAAQGL